MAVPHDSASKFQEYARPEMLVSTDWLAEHLDDPGLVVAESDEDVLLYETGHIPGAVKVDWHTELNDPVVRDYAGVYAGADLGLRPVRHALDVTGTPDTTRPELTHLALSTTRVDSRRHAANVHVWATLQETGAAPRQLTMVGPTGRTVALDGHAGTDDFSGTVVIRRVQKAVLAIPQRATFEALDKRYVYVVDEGDVAHRREVVVRTEVDDLFLVKAGLVPGERIVVDGVRQVRDGGKVESEGRAPEKAGTAPK